MSSQESNTHTSNWLSRFLRRVFGAKKKTVVQSSYSVSTPQASTTVTTLVEWRHSLEKLQPIVRDMRNSIDELNVKELSFDILGAGTFLLQIDLLLIKIRQHFNNYERRLKELNVEHTPLQEVVHKLNHSCQHVCTIMEGLHQLLINKTYRDLNHHDVINQVHSLECETKILAETMSALNDLALKRDPLYQLFEAELLKTLTDLKSGARAPAEFQSTPGYTEPATGPLRSKSQSIHHPEKRQIAFCFISCYESLKRCSALFTHQNVNALVDLYRHQLDDFITLCQLPHAPDETLGEAVHQLFHTVDAMRFTPMKGFSDKAKSVKRQMKQGLEHTPSGQAYLKSIRMSPRTKLSLKDKFK